MKKACSILILTLCILGNISFSCWAENLKIHFIDVGEGDSILIQTPNDKAVLIDTGNLITGFRLNEYLKKVGIQNLEYLIFTHHHPDHIGGAFFILQIFDIKRISDNGQDLTKLSKSSDLYRWYEELMQLHNNEYSVLNSGNEFIIDGVIFKILWPPKKFVFDNFNDNSIVIVMQYNNFKSLFLGDISVLVEKELINITPDLKAEVLKVGHHGANDASSEEFLKQVSPVISIVSVDKDNIHGYPSEKVLKRLKTLNSKVYRTDTNGNIILEITKKGEIGVKTER